MNEKECIADKMRELELRLTDMELMANADKKKNESMSLKNEAMRLKMKKIKKFAIEKETGLQQAFACIVILVAIGIANLGSCKC